MLAKQAATVDAISGGRLILGLGAGWNEREYRAFGFPYDHRVSRFEEAFTIIRSLLREGRADFEGAYYRVRDCVLDPGPARPGGPPLMLGSVGPRMLEIGLPHVEAWNVWWSDYGNTPGGFADVRDRVDAAAVQAGCGLRHRGGAGQPARRHRAAVRRCSQRADQAGPRIAG
jgi:alkanesulfonate monooxygenase SsuD/methylene tetrahydromethanopterin reductase-like flavin-dependent oxidoreductase (luciferase family)